MQYSKNALAIALVLALSACGGGGDSSEPTSPESIPVPDQEPPANSAPVATNDSGSTVNDANVQIDVLGNDSDDDNDTLSLEAITTQPENGSVAIEGDMAVYTPNVGYYGTDTFSYRISDGEETAEGEATVTVGQEVVVEGVVADSQNNEVKVSVDLGDEVVSTTSDTEGRYELTFVIEKANNLISLTSEQQVGNSTLKLASALGSSDQLVEAATSQSGRRLTDTTLSKAKISYLTTAMWVFYEHQRGESEASVDEFEAYVATLSLEQLVDTASFIKVLATSPDYSMASGIDTLSFFTSSDASVEDTIFAYLSDRDAVSQSGDLSDNYLMAFESARKELIENGRLSRPVASNELAGNVWAQVRIRGNFSAETDSALTFADGGTGKETGLLTDRQDKLTETLTYSWTLRDDGAVAIEYDQNSDNETSYTFACSGDPRLALFSEQAQTEAAELCEGASENAVLPGSVAKKSLTLNKISEVNGVSHFQSEAQYTYTLALEAAGNEDYTAQQTELDVKSFATTPEALSLEASSITANRWSFTVPTTIEYTIPAPDGDETVQFSGHFPDLINFTESATFSSDNTGASGTWRLMDDGTLQLQFASETVSVLPFMETDFSMLALITVDSGEDTFSFVSEMVPEDTASLESFKLVQALPKIWSSQSHCPVEGCWTYGKLKARKFAGFSFNSDKTMTWLNATPENDAFETASPTSNTLWQRDPSNFIEVVTEGQDENGNTYLEYRSWKLVQQSDDGWLKVIELYAVHLYYADDREPVSFKYKPHIESLRLIDLSETFPAMWQNTQEQGGF